MEIMPLHGHAELIEVRYTVVGVISGILVEPSYCSCKGRSPGDLYHDIEIRYGYLTLVLTEQSRPAAHMFLE